MKTTDPNWLARYRAGDVSALGELVEQYRRPLFAFILRMTEGRDEAEDIFQEVWIRAIRHLDTFKDRKLLSWLFRIAHNVIIDRARKRKPDCSLQDTSATDTPLEQHVAAPTHSPADVAGYRDLHIRMSAAIDQLPLDQRSVFLMRMEGDLSFKEIARIQSISINTALARMRYAVLKLRAELADEYAQLARSCHERQRPFLQ